MADTQMAVTAHITELSPGVVLVEVCRDEARGYTIVLTLDMGRLTR